MMAPIVPVPLEDVDHEWVVADYTKRASDLQLTATGDERLEILFVAFRGPRTTTRR